MEIIKNFKKGIIQGLGIIFIILLSGITYSAWTSLSTETDGATITVDKWNAIINRLNSIDQNQLTTAWVNFDGTNCSGGVGLNECTIGTGGSYNISKIIRLSTGQYMVYFSTGMANLNYAISGLVTFNSTYMGADLTQDERIGVKTLNNFGIGVYDAAGSVFQNSKNISIIIYGGK